MVSDIKLEQTKRKCRWIKNEIANKLRPSLLDEIEVAKSSWNNTLISTFWVLGWLLLCNSRAGSLDWRGETSYFSEKINTYQETEFPQPVHFNSLVTPLTQLKKIFHRPCRCEAYIGYNILGRVKKLWWEDMVEWTRRDWNFCDWCGCKYNTGLLDWRHWLAIFSLTDDKCWSGPQWSMQLLRNGLFERSQQELRRYYPSVISVFWD